jgi:hypothetical protein
MIKKYPMDNFKQYHRTKFDHESAMMAAMGAYETDLRHQEGEHADEHSHRSLDLKSYIPAEDAEVNKIVL